MSTHNKILLPTQVHSVDDIRKSWGADWANASDAEIINAYARATSMNPEVVASMLGTTLNSPTGFGKVTPSFGDRLSEKAVGGAVLGFSLVMLLLLIILARKLFSRTLKAFKRSIQNKSHGASSLLMTVDKLNGHEDSQAHDVFYEQAINELENSGRDKAIWARAMVASDGNLDKAKAQYIKLRVIQLTTPFSGF